MSIARAFLIEKFNPPRYFIISYNNRKTQDENDNNGWWLCIDLKWTADWIQNLNRFSEWPHAGVK